MAFKRMLQSGRLQDASLVVCNVYVSTSAQKVLSPLLRLAQSHPSALLVHSFVDHTYNRSSFHWTGPADAITHVATIVAQGMLDMTAATRSPDSSDHAIASDHPAVGIVDHIAVMPLHNDTSRSDIGGNGDDTPSIAARSIGSALEDRQTVLYYGGAHPEGFSLAHVRRTQTDFFRSTTTAHRDSGTSSGIIVVGSPPFFVENYNIRVRALPDARSLTQRLRTKDGGLPHVEALTLRYGKDCWEVACNLTCPEETSLHSIDAAVDAFEKEHGVDVQERYRVGTTADQCKTAWEQTNHSDEERRNYDERVHKRFEGYFDKERIST